MTQTPASDSTRLTQRRRPTGNVQRCRRESRCERGFSVSVCVATSPADHQPKPATDHKQQGAATIALLRRALVSGG